MQNTPMIRILSPFLLVVFSTGCEMPQYNSESLDDKYPAEAYEPKESSDPAPNYAPKPHQAKKNDNQKAEPMQDPGKSFSEAKGNLIKGKARKPSPSENLLQ